MRIKSNDLLKYFRAGESRSPRPVGAFPFPLGKRLPITGVNATHLLARSICTRESCNGNLTASPSRVGVKRTKPYAIADIICSGLAGSGCRENDRPNEIPVGRSAAGYLSSRNSPAELRTWKNERVSRFPSEIFAAKSCIRMLGNQIKGDGAGGGGGFFWGERCRRRRWQTVERKRNAASSAARSRSRHPRPFLVSDTPTP